VGLADSLATTGLWWFRLSSAWSSRGAMGQLSAPVTMLDPAMVEALGAAHTPGRDRGVPQ